MLSIPRLALCSDRRVLPKTHPTSGSPEDWLSTSVINRYGYGNISFDFFINWSRSTVGSDLWIKKISKFPPSDLCKVGVNQLTKFLIASGEDLNTVEAFCDKYCFSCHYKVFQDDVDWSDGTHLILDLEIIEGSVRATHLQSLGDVMAEIRELSGGPVAIGRKGLTYGTSSLECHLSCTDALWPGDVDAVLWNQHDKQVIALLEYKKHNLDSPIALQTLANYYPVPDRRKYERIELLATKIDRRVPIILIYYPTKKHINQVKMERIANCSGRLISVNNNLVELPTLSKDASIIKFVESLMVFINE